ncbi:MAG: signal recognition particle protein [Candidatus Marinimicrobia bacterium]|nr:signal recognition particle protein [Candidatus Neomarinimicrobiota bacterium]
MFSLLSDKFYDIFRNVRGFGTITDSNIQSTVRDIRKALIDADVNFKVVKSFVSKIEKKAKGTKVIKSIKPGEHFIKIVYDEMVSLLGNSSIGFHINKRPSVILLAGLQGVGKTTSAGKLAYYLKGLGNSVLLVNADIYRPAAVDQLKTIGSQINVEVFFEADKNPVEISKNAVEYAKEKNIDAIIIDTAGRLHLDDDMMLEIRRLKESVNPDEIFYVADGMSGQDAINSVKVFNNVIPLTGNLLTKMDGDSRGGAALSICSITGVPIKFIGTSEKIDGIEVFDPKRMADRILGFGDVISLVEKAKSVVDEKNVTELEKKMRDNKFDLEDFKNHIQQIKKIGSMSSILNMLPGRSSRALKNLRMDDRQIIWTEAIINSMNKNERKTPNIINGSRRLRIAKGSGRTVQEVNALLKQFTQMKKMMKKMNKFNKFNFASI